MSRRLTLNIPDGTKAISISVVAEGKDGSMSLVAKGVDTKDILEGKNIEIEIGRNNQ